MYFKPCEGSLSKVEFKRWGDAKRKKDFWSKVSFKRRPGPIRKMSKKIFTKLLFCVVTLHVGIK